MNEDVSDEALVRQMRDMKESDLSILSAALNQGPRLSAGFELKGHDIHLATLDGSANHFFWQKLERRGWLASQDVAGATNSHSTRLFVLLPQGRDPIKGLFAKWSAARTTHADAMAKINNQKCLPFVRDLVTSVQAGGGSELDIAILAARTLKTIIMAAGPRGREEEVLEGITQMSRDLLAEEKQASSTS